VFVKLRHCQKVKREQIYQLSFDIFHLLFVSTVNVFWDAG
jgi:hypothetical protein